MTGFSPSLMQGLMTANSAMSVATVNKNAISRMATQKQTLQAEIASGNGDVEGKQEEIERIDAQTARAEKLQQSALAAASSGVSSALTVTDTDEKTQGTTAANKEEKDTNTASDEAKAKASELQNKLKDHDIAAVDYHKGMNIDTAEDRVSVAISPDFLSAMSENSALSSRYEGYLSTMQDVQEQTTTPAIQSQNWSVDRNGLISRYATVSATTSDDELNALRTSLQNAGRAAFGNSFASAIVSREEPTSSASVASAGLLVDTAV